MTIENNTIREGNLSVNDSIILSSFYLPPIEYFYRILNAPSFEIDLLENYSKQSYRNRCHIYTANGMLPLSIPVHKTNGNHTLLKDIQISYIDNWQTNHWRAIESAYNKSPFFLYYKDDLQKMYSKTYQYLWEFNSDLCVFILKKLKLKKEIIYTNDFVKPLEQEEDYRFTIHPKVAQNTLLFPKYYQVFEPKYGFMQNLSIIDLLFNEGPESHNYLQQIQLAK